MGIRNLALAVATMASAAAVPSYAQDAEPRIFAMQDSWTLDAGDDYCRLAASFTDGDDEIGFALERNRAENFARLILIGEPLTTYRGTEALGYSYMPNGTQRRAMFLRSETDEGLPYFNLGNVIFGPDPFARPAAQAAAAPPASPPPAGAFVVPPYDRQAEREFAAGIDGIAIVDGLRQPVQLDTGNMEAPIEALQACTDDLLRVWGLDFEKHRSMTRRASPVGNAWEWLATGTIGFGDFRLLGGGANPVRVMVDAQGQPTACEVHWPSLSERTNRRICSQIMENGEFTPALDADGEAMASYWMVDPIFGLVRPFGS
ncbi:hypothetical protein [Aurantiacibacter hainanensis]|uniref:hypothetical protein n=1 Tax=Aurantiacibacter hainanensis TaxID=3076114 RepID=UPI0030C707D8